MWQYLSVITWTALVEVEAVLVIIANVPVVVIA